MPVPFFALPAILWTTQSGVQKTAVDQLLEIEWRTQTVFLEEQKVVFGGGVKATYGVTTLTADTLTVYTAPEGQRGVAEGNVHVVDPEGTIDANKIDFNWVTHTGEAERVRVQSGEMQMEAQHLSVQPDRWLLTNVKVLECGFAGGMVGIWSPSVLIEPGKQTTARRVEVSLFGHKVVTLRRHNVSLDRKSEGFKLPSVSVRRGRGMGVTWQHGVPLTNSTYTDFRFASFPERRPSATLNISRSLINPDRVRALLTPRSDLAELFNFGYLENINVGSPESEREYLSHDRLTLGLGSVLNAGVTGQTGRDSLNKPWDVVLEGGGTPGGFATLNQFHVQRMDQTGKEVQTRSQLISTVQTPSWRLGTKWDASVRADARYFWNEGGEASWGRLQAQTNWIAAPWLRLGAGYSLGANRGEFAFDFDRLPRTRVAHIRGDFFLGPTLFNALGKYDPVRKDWFDFEFALSHRMGCFEPYVVWRKSPSTVSFGLRIKVFEAFDRLKDALPRRTKGNRIEKPKPKG